MNKQNYTSKFTSVNTTKLPAIYKKIDWDKIKQTFPNKSKYYVFDYGCGRSTDHIQQYMLEKNWTWIGWDPNWDGILLAEVFDDLYKKVCNNSDYLGVILTSNVLNVIDNKEEIRRIMAYCSQSSNILYFHKIYSGDASGKPRVTKADCWQWNQPAKWYIKDKFDVVKGGDIITHSLYTRFIKSK